MAAQVWGTMRRRWLTAITAAVLVVVPTAARACPKCFESSGPRVLDAYYLSTALLSLLPFAIIGAVGLIASRLARRARACEQQRDGTAALEPLL